LLGDRRGVQATSGIIDSTATSAFPGSLGRMDEPGVAAWQAVLVDVLMRA